MLFFLVPVIEIVIISSLLIFMFALMAFGMAYIITPESFSADIRNAGVGLCSASNRLGCMLAPIIASYTLSLVDGDWLVVGIFGISMLIAGLCGMALKETKGVNIEL